jgi:sigma-54-specific transcriptional regulator
MQSSRELHRRTMPYTTELPNHRLLTLPLPEAGPLSIRAKALLFHDPLSIELLGHVERIARSEASVLVIGETGTGKELIARHMHAYSGRRGPFLAVNCGAFSESLIDAELFGHESGAFTGAVQSRAGWFEAANGGTLFLDEIGDLPLALQVKLLRVLQERQVVRLGSRKAVALDVRLVAATNINLLQAVEAQHFRADLFYRLSVATVDLPPLRARRGDIVPLALHFISTYAPRLGMSDAGFSAEAVTALLDYPWPGNIRELENVIHFALIICRHGLIEAGDLKLVAAVPRRVAVPLPVAENDDDAVGVGCDGDLPSPAGTASPKDSSAWEGLDDALSALLEALPPRLLHGVEEALVRAAFTQVGGNQVHAARVLGVTRNTLRTLLKRYGLLAEPSAASHLTLDPTPAQQPASH